MKDLYFFVKNLFRIFGFILVFLFVLCASIFIGVHFYFGRVSLNQILFHIAFWDIHSVFQWIIPIVGVFSASLGITYLITRHFWLVLCFIGIVVEFIRYHPMIVHKINGNKPIPVWQQVFLSFQETELYRRHYVVPELIHPLPDKPKNIIVLFVESMEKTFADKSYWDENLIPRLTQLSDRYMTIDGYEHINGTNWTLASQISVLCGLPFKMQLRDKLGTQTKQFFPNAVCVSDLLKKSGYKTIFAGGGGQRICWHRSIFPRTPV